MRMKREEHYSVYRAIHGGGGPDFYFFIFLAIFGLQLQIRFFLIGPSEKSGIEIESGY